ncbi:MAG: hypothetical protein ACUVYA_19790, partial [Planctomycetota bacterium]
MRRTTWIAALFGAALAAPSSGAAAEPVDPRIEEDWRKEAGIGTPRVPATYRAAIEKTLRRGSLLYADLEASGQLAPRIARRWERAERAVERARAGGTLG